MLMARKKSLLLLGLALSVIFSPAAFSSEPKNGFVVMISANAEWKPVRRLFPEVEIHKSPLGEWFTRELKIGERQETVIFFHGGWGKISAAASTQYVIDRWTPKLLINLGTCGGLKGGAKRDETILVERTVVYDIIEQMGDSSEAIEAYSTDLDLSWLADPMPFPVTRSLMISGDRDLVAKEIPELKARYKAVAGDWESGAIAWVAKRNKTKCLILRTVSDVVSEQGGDVYGNFELFEKRTQAIMKRLIDRLPAWLERTRLD